MLAGGANILHLHEHWICKAEARRIRVQHVVGEELRIGGVDILRPVEVQTTRPLVTGAELPVAGNHMFDGEVSLLRIAILEILRHGQREGKNGQRKTGGQIVLVRE